MAFRVFRLILEYISVFALLLATLMTISALCTPEWQVVNMKQLNQLHYHGLWQDCVYGNRAGGSENSKDWECTIKLYGQTKEEQELHGHHKSEQWRLLIIVLMAIASLVGLIAICFAVVATCLDTCRVTTCMKTSAVLWFALHTLATFACSAAIIIFVRKSQEIENRYVLELTDHALQTLGTSFYLGVAGCIAFVLSMLLSLACLTLVCIASAPSQSQPYASKLTNKTWPQGSSQV